MLARSLFTLLSLFTISARAQPYAPNTDAACLLLFATHGKGMAQFRGRANYTHLAEISPTSTSIVPGAIASTDNNP
ncbi:MAG: hypothetical protein E2O50_03215 [Gammaproteobacteria bacterium]|nr:MAG: hypothetical protein E2O50_03215 [Gammaproteobacteria bacterium]